jgi:hypothetical protein
MLFLPSAPIRRRKLKVAAARCPSCEISRCRHEIAAIEAKILAGNPDLQGLCLALSDWSAELRILQAEVTPGRWAFIRRGGPASASSIRKCKSRLRHP